jgi:outer membrane biosynthesis protein TonB
LSAKKKKKKKKNKQKKKKKKKKKQQRVSKNKKSEITSSKKHLQVLLQTVADELACSARRDGLAATSHRVAAALVDGAGHVRGVVGEHGVRHVDRLRRCDDAESRQPATTSERNRRPSTEKMTIAAIAPADKPPFSACCCNSSSFFTCVASIEASIEVESKPRTNLQIKYR